MRFSSGSSMRYYEIIESYVAGAPDEDSHEDDNENCPCCCCAHQRGASAAAAEDMEEYEEIKRLAQLPMYQKA